MFPNGTIALGGVSNVAPRSALRASRACDRCRQKKQRCEVLGNGPCQLCIAVRMECEWTHIDKRSPQSETRVSELEATIQALKDEINSLKQHQGDAVVATQHNLAAVENRLAALEQSSLGWGLSLWTPAGYPPEDAN